MALSAGELFAGFTIERLLGAGGMGEVYLAQHPRLPRREALKILRADISIDESFRQRFIREADSIAALEHPHIVTVHDRGDADGRLWIATQFVDGADAALLLRDRYPAGMPADELAAITTAIAEALDYAHGTGLLHRDVKPANILLAHPDHDGNRRIYLADFGIARPLDDPAGLTATNFTLGTFASVAPEQLMGKAIDGRADQYALAATAYHLLTGKPVYSDSNPVAVISKHLAEPPPAPSTGCAELAPFDAAFARALAKKPEDRFDRCQDFARAITAAAAASGVSSPTAPTQEARIAEPIAQPRPRRKTPPHKVLASGSPVATSSTQPATLHNELHRAETEKANQAVSPITGHGADMRPRTSAQSQRVGLSSRFSQYSPNVQSMLSASLLLPTLIIWEVMLRTSIPFAYAITLANLVCGLFFLGVLAVVARTPRRRSRALIVGAITVAANSSAVWALDTVGDDGVRGFVFLEWLVLPIGFVLAWDIARRQHSRWRTIGLTLAAVTMVILRIVVISNLDGLFGGGHWFGLWFTAIGVVAVGCAIGWAIDGYGRSRDMHSILSQAGFTRLDDGSEGTVEHAREAYNYLCEVKLVSPDRALRIVKEQWPAVSDSDLEANL